MIDKIEIYSEVHHGGFRKIFFHRGDLTHVYIVKDSPNLIITSISSHIFF